MKTKDLIIGNSYQCESVILKLIAITKGGDPILISESKSEGYSYCTKDEAIKHGFTDAWRPDCFCHSLNYFLKTYKPL